MSYLPSIVVLLLAAVFVVAVFKRLNLSPVLGYLVAGALIGEHGFGMMASADLASFAKFGVVFLLFAIGIELTMERLMSMRWHVFGFGTLQFVITALVIGYTVHLLNGSIQQAIIIGGSLALSSTAIVLRVVAEGAGQATQVGRLALAVLLLQDFAVVPLLVLVPLLAQESGDITWTLASTTGKAIIAMFVIFFLGRMLLRPLFRAIASVKSNELFVAATLLVVLGTSWVTDYMGLSLALGAFIAGLLVAETQYQHQVEDTIMPFKDLLMGLFFMSVGMTISIQTMVDQWPSILGAACTLIFVKTLIILGLSRVFKFPWGASIHAGLLLSQGSEFAFILFGIASQFDIGLLEPDTAQFMLTVVTITMAVTPALSILGTYINKKLEQKDQDTWEENTEGEEDRFTDLNKHVIVAGFGRVGKMVARMLEAKKLSYVVIEADAKRVKEGKKQGYPVVHGDPTKMAILRQVGIDRAKTIILTIRDDIYMKKAIREVHAHCPYLPIVVRADDLKHAKTLRTLGAMVIVPETYEAGLQLAGALMKAIGISEQEVSRIKNQFRAGNYERAKEAIEIENA